MKGEVLGAGIFPHPPIVIDEIGGIRRGEAKKTIDGMEKLSKIIGKKNPDTIIVISPHGIMFRDSISIYYEDILVGDFNNFGEMTLSYEYENDKELIDLIVKKSDGRNISTTKINKDLANGLGHTEKLDHGTLVPMDFVEEYVEDFKLITLTYGLLKPEELYEFGLCIKEAVEESDKRVMIIASGDLSHKLKDGGPYDFHPSGEIYDGKIVSLIEDADMDGILNFDKELCNEAGECGLRSFQIMAGILDDEKIESEVLSYEGPFGVGYMTAYIDILKGDESNG